MTTSSIDDEQELLRLVDLMLEASRLADAATLNHYIADDYLLTYSLYEQDKRGFMNKEQVVAQWGSQQIAGATITITDQRVFLSGDTGIVYGLVTDKIPTPEGERIIRTWVSDVWVKRNGEWRWLASHESFLK